MVNKEVLEYIKKSFDLKAQGYYKPAIEMLYKALTVESDNIEILSQLAELYFLLENNRRAIHYIEKTLEINPFHIDCLKLMKNIYLQEENYIEAEKAAVKIFDINQNCENLAEKIKILNKMNDLETVQSLEELHIDFDDKVLFEFARSYYINQKYERAIKFLEKAVEKNPKNTDAELLLAETYFLNNDLEKSRALFEKLEKEVSDSKLMNYLGLFMLDEMKLEKAIKYFNGARKLDEKNSRYAYNLANAYFLSGWMEEAVKCFNLSICLEPENPDYHYALAYLYFQKEDYDKASAEVREILKINRNHPQTRVLDALIKAKKGDVVAAKVELDEIVKKNPNDDFAMFSLAKICVELSQLDKADELMTRALEMKPKSLNYLKEYAEILIDRAHHGEAQEQIEKILELNENFVEGYVLQAKNYISIKDYEGAFDAAQKVIELDPNCAEGYFYNALVLFEQGDTNFAIESLKKAISLDVNNAMYYVQMSEFYQKMRQFENALVYIREASSIDESAKNKELYAKLASIVRKAKPQESIQNNT